MRVALAAAGLCGLGPATIQAQSPADILSRFKPVLKGVEYDIPETPAEIEACKLERVMGPRGEVIGFAVRDGQGKLLRRFVDTNGKLTQRPGESKPQTHLDQWSYYRDGFEVYREIDSNEDANLDEVRWLNQGGTRIGEIRAGKLVGWKRISPEEASRVLVQAIVASDLALLETVMATPAEAESLGLPAEMVRRLADGQANRAEAVQALQRNLKGWDQQTVWSRFDGMMPHAIPEDAAPGLTSELVLYENAVIFVTPSASSDARSVAYLHAPEMIRIGETWKFLGLPRAVDPSQPVLAESDSASLRSLIFGRPDPAALAGDGASIPPDLLKALADHDNAMPGGDASAKELAQWHLDRIEILRKIIAAAKNDDERLTFYKQVIHDLAEAYRSGLYPQGAEVFDKLIAQGGKVGSFAAYRKILAEFDLEADQPDVNLLKVQENTVKKLEAFLEQYPQADEVPDVLFQIANIHVFNGEEEQGRKYFARLVAEAPQTDVGRKAAGALKRIDSDGKPLTISGLTLNGETLSTARLRGKTVLVLFWMSVAEPDRRELSDLLDLYKRYRDKGFEVVTVNLDADRAELDAFLKQTSLPWPVIYEAGGLDSRLANEFGIINTPTMILIGPDGNVLSHRITRASEVARFLEKPLAAGSLGNELEPKR
jgi:thiol-disulfide isomerase/thioredoxin